MHTNRWYRMVQAGWSRLHPAFAVHVSESGRPSNLLEAIARVKHPAEQRWPVESPNSKLQQFAAHKSSTRS